MSVYSIIPLRRPRRSVHFLDHPVNTSLNIGELVPTSRPIECVPGDTFDISQVATCQLMPMVKPAKGNLWLESWAFYVTNDMLYKNTDSGKFSEILLSAQNPKEVLTLPYMARANSHNSLCSYWDYFGLPVGVGTDASGLKIIKYPFRGIYKIWDDYFRDENLQEEIFSTTTNGYPIELGLTYVNYKKDRFTSAFQSEQKGSPIRVPILGQSKVNLYFSTSSDTVNPAASIFANSPISAGTSDLNLRVTSEQELTGPLELRADINSVGISINDLRLSNKLQKWSERIQLAGSRPKEYLLANYGIAPNDETLQRPVLIGHIKTPVIVDSVVQNNPTSESVSATKSGNGYTVSKTRFGKWTCKEFGWIYVLSALRPDSIYTQGIHRSLIKQNVYDFFNPIFESLGQQEILNCELYAQNTEDDKNVWGYTDRYNEYRNIEGMTTGALRANIQQSLDPWVIQRKFAELPTLSSEFIKVNPSEYDYLFNFVHSSTRPQAILHCANFIKAIRPISKYAHPSL